MLFAYIISSLVLSSLTSASDTTIPTTGFSNPSIKHSTGNLAVCVTGIVKLTVTANNTKILYPEPPNQVNATATILALLQANPTIYTTSYGGSNLVTGSYNIYSELCFPNDAAAASKVQTVQFLTHGATLDHTYWDIASGYSHVDAAIAAGYATFSYDRLGVGKSDHPDPIQVVQAAIAVEVAHTLVQLIRTTNLGGYSFKNVVGIGHSAGSTITQGVSAKYPKDFEAVILTGTSIDPNYVATSVAAFDLIIANTDPSGRFVGIGNAYFTQPPLEQALQFPFYRYPYFDPSLLQLAIATRQTNTLGELLTLASINVPSPLFTGPVDVVLGMNDLVFCGGDCTYPTDQSALVQPAFYPAARTSSHYLSPNAGHVINAHYSASQAFAQMNSFLRLNKLG
ncbi:hypothetical protein MMC27_007573 [Xylographa pallens]|nr:hypothetical protein [Xylographa pallens]